MTFFLLCNTFFCVNTVTNTNSLYSFVAVFAFVVDSDGSIDFGTIKVSEEVKRSIKLENKGKYDIAFK